MIKDSYYKSIYDIQQDNGLAFSFSKLSEKQIDHVLKSKWSGVNYSSRIWSNTNELARNVKEELLLNLMTGRSNEEAARAIQGRFNTGMMEARRLIRTESCYIVNEMEAQSFEECGIDKYMYVATLDKKTSKECREHDSKVYLVKNRKAGVNFPPLHPWCRSTTIAYLGNDILADMERRARNDDTGETYTVPATTSYQEWFDGLVEKDGMLRFDLDLQLFGSESPQNDIDKVKEIMSSQLNNLTQDEKQVITEMTGALSQKINSRIFIGSSIDKFSKKMQYLDNALSKGKIPEDITLYRSTDIRYLAGYKGGRTITEEAVDDLIGKVVTNDIYTSTSFSELKLDGRNTYITYIVPKGTLNALYIKGLAYEQYKFQDEVLFGRGLRYRIKKAKIVDGKVYLRAEVLSND